MNHYCNRCNVWYSVHTHHITEWWCKQEQMMKVGDCYLLVSETTESFPRSNMAPTPKYLLTPDEEEVNNAIKNVQPGWVYTLYKNRNLIKQGMVEKTKGPPTAKEIMKRKTPDEYMSWAIETAGSHSPHRRPRWSHVMNIFHQGSGVAQALCIKYGYDPDETMGLEWTECPTCGTEFEE